MNTIFTEDYIKEFHKNGLMLSVWTATPTDKNNALKYRDLGIDLVCADMIENILNE